MLAHVFVSMACVCLSALSTYAFDGTSRIVLRPEVSRSHREELTTRLRVITGLSALSFDSNGSLRLGEQTSGGSESARTLLAEAVAGPNVRHKSRRAETIQSAFCAVCGFFLRRSVRVSSDIF